MKRLNAGESCPQALNDLSFTSFRNIDPKDRDAIGGWNLAKV
jgi:hypothetical protein